MAASLEPGFSLTKEFFYGSVALPYLLVLLVPHTLSMGVLLYDFFALITLGVTSIMLVIQAVRQRGSVLVGLYPLGGVAAVFLFFGSEQTLQRAGDYLDFQLHRPQLEKHLELLSYKPAPADTIRVGFSAYCDFRQGICYDVQPPGILLCTTDGEASNRFWGYAYSPADVKPHFIGKQLSDWYHLTGHWYRWERPD